MRGDAGRLRQVLTNLHRQRREVHRTRRSHRARDAGERNRHARRRCALPISDTGIGISAEAQRKLVSGLRPGRRLDDAQVRRHRTRAGHLEATRRVDGRRDRRRQHAGRRLDLLVHRTACSRRQSPDFAPPGRRAARVLERRGACWSSTINATGPSHPARTRSIRMVHDARDEAASGGESALAMPAPLRGRSGRPYDVVILDVARMPEMDGLDAARAVKDDPRVDQVRLAGADLAVRSIAAVHGSRSPARDAGVAARA
ncbi:MAG: hypothetical protein WKF84_30155 [Pyrinomonadaceae bacterium]